MYRAEAFKTQHTTELHALIEQYSFGTLISSIDKTITANHLPFFLDKEAGSLGYLRCHVARSNPVWQTLCDQEILITFQGPNCYISPSWYPSKHQHGKAVPTWNYVAVQAKGRATIIDEPSKLLSHITELTNKHESGQAKPWTVSDAPDDFIETLSQAIVGIEIPILELNGTIKANQNRSTADQMGVLAGLSHETNEQARAIAQVIKSNLG